jgi:hypothetical protein
VASNFAALEDRTARASLRHLSNAVATGVDRGGYAVRMDVIFDAPAAEILGMEDSRPSILALTQQAASLEQQGQLTITRKTETEGVDYAIVARSPDPSGLARIELERVQ